MRVALYINESKAGAKAAAARLAARAATFGLEVAELDSLSAGRPLLLALGGDGTILRCVREHPGIPVLGLNLGGLGYLSPIEERDFDAALSLLSAGRYRIAERTMLALAPPGSGSSPQALNDIVVTREMTGHAALMELSIDGHRPTRYLADGLVIATPTGSTAYSLSAGGPVVMPDSRSFVITPMNPHALGIRPQVVSDSVEVKVTCASRDDLSRTPAAGPLGVYADGEAVAMLAPGESLSIRKSDRVAKFVELDGYDPYAVLAHKLGWTGTAL